MGADLITFIVVGKPSINISKAKVVRYWEKNKKFLMLEDDENETDIWPDKGGFQTLEEFSDFIGEFENMWNGVTYVRDLNSRLINGNRQKVVVVGERTSGDEPDGVGYQMMLKVFQNELGDFLGLK